MTIVHAQKTKEMSNAHMPPDFLQPSLFSIEEAVLLTDKDHPRLEDKDVEQVFDQLRDFYKKLAQGQSPEGPTSSLSRKQALLDRIMIHLAMRKELGEDVEYLQNPRYTLGGRTIPRVETLYATAFNYLRRSVRFWRKQKGAKGYLGFLQEHMPT